MKVCFSLSLLILSVFGSSSAIAFQYESESRLNLPDRLTQSKDSTTLDGSVQLIGSHFLTEQRTSVESENYGYLGAAFDYRDKKGNFDSKKFKFIETYAFVPTHI